MAFQRRQEPSETLGAVILDLTPRLPVRSLTVWQRFWLWRRAYRPGLSALFLALLLGAFLGTLWWDHRADAPFQAPLQRLLEASRQNGGRFVHWVSPKGPILLRIRGLHQGVDTREDAPRPVIPLLSAHEQRLSALWVQSRMLESVPVDRLVAVSVLLLDAPDPAARASAREGLAQALARVEPGSALHTSLSGDLAVAHLLGGEHSEGLARFREVLALAPRDPVILYNGIQLLGRGLILGDELAVLARFLQEEPDLLWRRDAEARYRALMR